MRSIDEYRHNARHRGYRIKIYDKKGGPILYLFIYYLPVNYFHFEWNKWNKAIRLFGFGFEFVKLPF